MGNWIRWVAWRSSAHGEGIRIGAVGLCFGGGFVDMNTYFFVFLLEASYIVVMRVVEQRG